MSIEAIYDVKYACVVTKWFWKSDHFGSQLHWRSLSIWCCIALIIDCEFAFQFLYLIIPIRSNTILANLSICLQQSKCFMYSKHSTYCCPFNISIIIVCNNYILTISLYQLLPFSAIILAWQHSSLSFINPIVKAMKS